RSRGDAALLRKMIMRIHHVQITIPSGMEESAREFYCVALGLAEIEKPAALAGRGGFWLQVGNLQLHVGTEDGVERSATKAHVAYEVTDVEYWRTRLESQAIAILEAVPIPCFIRFEAR